MENKHFKVNGIEVVDITPELTEEEIIERANYIVEGLLHLGEKSNFNF